MSETDADRATETQTDPEEVREAIKENYADPEDGQHYNDREKLDFDPADGLYSGTAVDGTSEVPGPHENQEDVVPEDGDETPAQRATDRAEEAIAGEDRTAETEAASRREDADVAAGQEIDANASRDASVDAGRHRAD